MPLLPPLVGRALPRQHAEAHRRLEASRWRRRCRRSGAGRLDLSFCPRCLLLEYRSVDSTRLSQGYLYDHGLVRPSFLRRKERRDARPERIELREVVAIQGWELRITHSTPGKHPST